MSHDRQTDVRVLRFLDGLMNADQVGGFDAGPGHIRSHSLTNRFDFHARSLEWKDNKTTSTPQMEETQTWFISGSFSHMKSDLFNTGLLSNVDLNQISTGSDSCCVVGPMKIYVVCLSLSMLTSLNIIIHYLSAVVDGAELQGQTATTARNQEVANFNRCIGRCCIQHPFSPFCPQPEKRHHTAATTANNVCTAG